MNAKTKLDVWNIDYIEEDEMIFKVMKYSSALKDISNEVKKGAWKGKWEEVPDEDLWQDGELISVAEVMLVIEREVLFTGKWKLIREIE